MERLLQDLRYAARMLSRSPGFTLVAVLTLAVGMGANTAVFSLIDSVLLRPLPVDDPDRVVALYMTHVGPDEYKSLSLAEYNYLRDHQTTLSSLAAWARIPLSLRRQGQLEQIPAEIVSGNFFAVLGLKASLGRLFTSSDDQTRGAHPLAVVSHRFWQQRLGSSPSVVGQTLDLNGHLFSIIGVAPATFQSIALDWGKQPELWLPMTMLEEAIPGAGRQLLEEPEARWLLAAGRLKDNVKRAQAESDIKRLAAQLETIDSLHNPGRSAVVLPMNQARFWPGFRREILQMLAIFQLLAVLVLLIACANVSSLLLARAAAREKEIGIRLALGAGTARLVRQWLTESLFLAICGSVAGIMFAGWLIRVLTAFPLPFRIPLSLQPQLDVRTVAFALMVAVVASILFGLAPLWLTARQDVARSIRSEAGWTSRHRTRVGQLRSALVMTQIALSLVSLIGAGLLSRTLWQLSRVKLGFDPDRLLLVELNLDPREYAPEKGIAFYRQVLETLGRAPEIQQATLTKSIPLSLVRMTPQSVEREDSPVQRTQDELLADRDFVAPNYFRVLGAPLVAGREFDSQDATGRLPVIIVSGILAEKLWGTADVVGKRCRVWIDRGDAAIYTVIGVAPEIRHRKLSEPPRPYFYLPLFQHYTRSMTLIVRASRDPLVIIGRVRAALRGLDPNVLTGEIGTMAMQQDRSLSQTRMLVSLSGVFGCMALFLTMTGLYGVLSYAVSRRTREIGVRMALGANQRQVLSLVIRQGMKLVFIGWVTGCGASLVASRVLSRFLFGVEPVDPVTFIAVSILLVAAAFFACYLPARKATAIDPVVALRFD